MFPIMFSQVNLNAFKLSRNDFVLWHRRFGHLNFTELQLLYKENIVSSLPSVQSNDYMCEPYIFGQHNCDKFPVEKFWVDTNPLMIIYVDIYRFIQVSSMNGRKYFFLFINDF